MPSDIFKLPLQIQLILAGGYAAYLLSYVGIRAHHTAVDTTFSTLVFGLIATLVYAICSSRIDIITSTVFAFLACCITGLLWRKQGRKWLKSLIRYFDISWSDDNPSALDSLLDNSDNEMSQISVLLDDGTWLMCGDTNDYLEAPFGPCILGPTGDVALYVTELTRPDGEKREQDDVLHSEYGNLITYVPASKIKYVTMRYRKRR